MIELIKINLLPYREQIEQRKKQTFKVLMLAALATGLGLAALTYMTIQTTISKQEERNNFLKEAISEQEKKLVQISQLQQEKHNFLARKQKIEELQHKRFQAAYIIDTLNVLIPEGTYLTSIRAENNQTYILNGKATSRLILRVFHRLRLFFRYLVSTLD